MTLITYSHEFESRQEMLDFIKDKEEMILDEEKAEGWILLKTGMILFIKWYNPFPWQWLFNSQIDQETAPRHCPLSLVERSIEISPPPPTSEKARWVKEVRNHWKMVEYYREKRNK